MVRTSRRRFANKILIGWMVIVLAGCNLSFPRVENPTRSVQPTQPGPSATLFLTASPAPSPTITNTPRPIATPLAPVEVETFPINSKYLGYARDISVYLPADYRHKPEARFKVLYAHDGQQVALLPLEQVLNGFYTTRQMEQIIIVAIHSDDNRVYEYGTGPIQDVFGMGTQSQWFGSFILKEVIPAINQKYRTLTGSENTSIMGWSLGGLSAFYLAWTHPEIFSLVGSFSSSFWWRTNADTLQELLNSRVIHKLVRENKNKPALRMWISVGTKEDSNDRDKNGVNDFLQDTTDLVEELGRKGFQNGADFVYVQVEGGIHDLSQWANLLPDFLRWAYPDRTAAVNH